MTTIPPGAKVTIRLPKATVRSLTEQEEFRSVCGMRRDLVGPGEDEPVRFHYMRIHDSQKHYHKRFIEYYYVAEGEGEMELDGEVVPVRKGDMIVVPPTVWHTSRPTGSSDLHILITVVPVEGSLDDPDTFYE